ncbi:MAG: DUF4680 domain-containing protein [Acidobacteriota bacterium]|nr:DUF4680 domain-containing protein [Acidobacteriota bacterium]
MHNKEKVQEAIVQRLKTSSGLDLANLDLTTTAVNFNKNLAYATVAFHPKGDPSVNSGMTMKYTLEERDGKWVVVKVGDSQGHGMPGPAAAGASELPPGHPSLDSAAPGSSMPTGPNPHVPPNRGDSPHGQAR